MNGHEEELTTFEIGVGVPKRNAKEESEASDCVEVFVDEIWNVSLIVERVQGIADEFIKLAAPMESLGRAAARLQLKKRTRFGIDLQFEWEEAEAFIGLSMWRESLLQNLYFKKIHLRLAVLFQHRDSTCIPQGADLQPEFTDEIKRKKLLKSWALHLWDFTNQPIDEIYSYFGTKIRINDKFVWKIKHRQIAHNLSMDRKIINFRTNNTFVIYENVNKAKRIQKLER